MEEVEGRRIEASRQKDEAQRLIKKTEDDVRKMILGLRPVEGI
jgi:signal transduction histidine kinase